jgi:hypothetical protein
VEPPAEAIRGHILPDNIYVLELRHYNVIITDATALLIRLNAEWGASGIYILRLAA